MRGSFFHGQGADKYTRRKEKKRQQNAREQQERALDRDAADKTRMRAERLRMLTELEAASASTEGAAQLTFVPDGAVDSDPQAPALLGFSPEAGEAPDAAEDGSTVLLDASDATELRTLRACYTCKARFRMLHHFYAHMCPACASLNYTKRLQSADLTDRTFLVTGGRVKVGFQVVLKLLRCGATVLVTSRFPADTAARFAAVQDAPGWLGRLQCFGLDLRDLSSLERFCAFLAHHRPHLDGIINNACQTIRRPAAYYAHLMPAELQPALWSTEVRALLVDNATCFAPPADARRSLPPPDASSDAHVTSAASKAEPVAGPDAATAMARTSAAPMAMMPPTATAAVPSALWSQAPLWPAEEGVAQPDEGSASDFPSGMTDVNGQQLDTRRTNSWLLQLQDVSTPEAAEVLAINALAPFVLNSRLRSLLEASPSPRRFVINVSAMEGKFYRHKSPNHPHTNMAKAALNMMTRTCAEELAGCGIYMNSVDTGWINDEKPIERAAAHAAAHHFQTPLDEVDAAARILDPVLSAAHGSEPLYGKFLKDYVPVEW